MLIVFDVDIVGSAFGEPLSYSWMNAQSVIDHSLADDRLHISFAATARDLSDNLVIHKVYFRKDSNNQELVVIWALGGFSNNNPVRANFGRLTDILIIEVRKEVPEPNDSNSQIAVVLRYAHADDLHMLPSKKN